MGVVLSVLLALMSRYPLSSRKARAVRKDDGAESNDTEASFSKFGTFLRRKPVLRCSLALVPPVGGRGEQAAVRLPRVSADASTVGAFHSIIFQVSAGVLEVAGKFF